MGLELAVEAMKAGQRSTFFTLEYTEKEVLDRFRAIGVDRAQFGGLFELDSSDTISADHIARRMATAPRGTVVVVDYLQLLDQKRDNPELMEQVRALKALARDKGLIVMMISQIDRILRSVNESGAGPGRCQAAQPARPQAVRQGMLPEPGRDAVPDSLTRSGGGNARRPSSLQAHQASGSRTMCTMLAGFMIQPPRKLFAAAARSGRSAPHRHRRVA